MDEETASASTLTFTSTFPRSFTRLADRRTFWLAWSTAVLIAAAIQLATLNVQPTIGLDETQMVEWGRTCLQPQSSWSINWTRDNRPLLSDHYIGCLAQEVGCRLSRGVPWGPRLMTLLGALVAATLGVGWLLSRGTASSAAGLLGMAFFLNHTFMASYRGGRVDCWALAAVMGAAWVLRSRFAVRHGLSASSLAGGLAALAFAVWPSAPLLFPLLVAEYASVYGTWSPAKPRLVGILQCAGVASLSAALTTTILLAPIRTQLPVILHQAPGFWSNALPRISLVRNAYGLSQPVLYDPFLGALALIGALRRSNWKLTLACLVSAAVPFLTKMDDCRATYFVPMALALASTSFVAAIPPEAERFNRLLMALLLCTVPWSAVTSLGRSTIIGLRHKKDRDPALLTRVASALVGAGPKRVFMTQAHTDFYYAGRVLGWRMFRTGTPPSESLAATMDYALARGNRPNVSYLVDAGLSFTGYALRQPTAPRRTGLFDRALNGDDYSIYSVYVRRQPSPRSDSCPPSPRPDTESWSKELSCSVRSELSAAPRQRGPCISHNPAYYHGLRGGKSRRKPGAEG